MSARFPRILMVLAALLLVAAAVSAQTPVLVKDIYPGFSNSNWSGGVVMGGIYYFQADDGTNGRELWRSDGSTAGTYLVKDINPGWFSSDVEGLVVSGGKLYFFANDGVTGKEPWVSDGTAAGTFLLKDVRPGSTTSLPGSNSPYMVGFAGKAFMTLDDGVTGRELWVSDGTVAGTQLFKDFNPAGPGCFAIAVAAGKIWLNGYMNGMGGELWKSDGTLAGTTFVADVHTAPGVGSSPFNFAEMNGIVYFSAQAYLKDSELHRTDGTAAGTYMVKEIATNNATAWTGGASPRNLTAVGNYLFFTADEQGSEGLTSLWRTDGTEAGTIELPLVEQSSSAAITGLINYNGTLLALHLYGSSQTDFWKSDGTVAGTSLFYGSGARAFNFVLADNLAFIYGGSEMLRTDGTAAGTLPYGNFAAAGLSIPGPAREFNGRLLVGARHNSYGYEPWTIALCNSFQQPVITTIEPEICTGGTGHASAQSSYATYAWTIANGTITTGQGTSSITYTASGAGAVQLTLNVTSGPNGCTGTANKSVPLMAQPVINASGPTTFCAGGSVTLTAPAGYTYNWSTGATTQSINVSTSGSYTVTVTNAYGCSVASAPRTVTVNANPATPVITPSGPTTFCTGGSVTLTAPAGYSYNWSTGATTQSINVTTSGAYIVTVTDANGCYASSAATNVTVNANPSTPTITPSGPTTFCEGGSVTLTASAAPSYLWSNGATTQSINVTASGSFSVTTTNASGCTATSTATAVTVHANPTTPAITPSGPTTFCEGGSVTLTAPAGFTYNWSTGATTQSINVTASGSYSVTVTNANGCSAASAATAVTVNPSPATPAITPSGATTFCEGGSVTLTAPAGFTYNWSTGATTQSIDVTASGSYSVTVTNASGCSTTSAPTAVTVNANPSTPAITPSGPTTFCEGGSVTLTAPAGFGYLWSTGAGTRSIVVTASGSYSVTVTNGNGCSAASAPTTVTVHPAAATPSITPSGPTTFCEGGSVTLTAPAGFSYNWSNGATTQSIDVTASGSYSVTVTNGNGCSATSAATAVTVNANPATPSITPSGPTTFCEGGSVTLTAPAGFTYNWSNGATTQSIAVTASGSFSVTVTNASGCSTTSAPTTVTVHPPASTPAITPSGPTTFCEGGSVTLTASAGSAWLWSNGATTQSINVTASGSFSVTVTNANGCSAASASTSVTVNPAPATPSITPSGPTTFCEGGSVTLTAPAGYAYSWSNGATTQSIAVTTSGSYSVTVTNGSGCSATSAPSTVTVHPAATTPSITPSGATTFCDGGSVTLTASAGSAWLWSNGATTQSINVTASGSFSVTVTNANGCSATSAATNVTVHPAAATPTVTPSGATTFCEGGSVTLTASSGASYFWSNGATTQSIVVTAGGSYSVTVSDANGCGATSAATVVTVHPNPSTPVITPSGPITFCEGGSVTLTAPAGFTYLWSTGATTQSINVTASGSYSVTVTNANGCSTASAPAAVTVHPAASTPSITPSGATTFCEGGSVTLTATAGAAYLWSNGATTQSINVTASGSYSVTVTNANGCGATSAATAVTVHPAAATPAITPSGATTFCEGGSVTLTASSGAAYLWSNGATTQSINVIASGSYSVTVTNENGCGATSAPVSVTVNANPATPEIGASGPTTFCEGGSVTLSAPAGFSYNWSNGATTQSIVVTAGGSYSVTVTNGSGCSAASAPVAVTVNANPSTPSIDASGSTTFCEGGSVTLSAPAGFSYNWSNGATTQSIVVTAGGSYSVTVTNGSGCGATSAPVAVTVNANPSTPVITPSGPTSFCEGGSVTLSAPAGFSYNWSNGATTQSIVVSASGSYSVTVTNGSGCSATSAPAVVTANANPATPEIGAGGPTTFCEGGSVTLSAPAGFSYNWSNGATTQSIVVTAGGSYSVTVTNGSGCSATSAPVAVTVNANPSTPVITPSGPTAFCQGGSVTLTASSGTSYAWSNGATTQSIVVSASGSYSVTVSNGSGCSATSAATNVTVHATPSTPVITPSGPTSFCEGGSVTLTAPSSAAYLWSTGATTQSIVVTANGSYSVTVTDGNGCSASSTPVGVNVNPLPAAEITASSTTLCEAGSVTLTASAGVSWLWSNGATTQSIDVSTPGSYTVTVSDGVCSNTSAPVTVVQESTTVSIVGNDPTLCPGQTVSATATVAGGTAVSYQWYGFGGQPIAGETGPSVSFTVTQTSTSYLFVRITTPAGCVIQSNVFIYNVSQPEATITANGPTTFCEGGAVELSAPDGTSLTYLWSNGATSRSIGVTAGGSYSVTVTNANGCSATSEPTVVTVNPAAGPADVAASGPTTFCEGGSVTLTAPAGYTYDWSTGATTQSIVVSATGSYSVTITNGSGCSAASTPVNVTVHANPSTPAITPSGATTFCTGGSVTLSAPAGFTYLWSTGATTQSINVTTGGPYSVTVTNANGCSAASAPTTVTVHANPSTPVITPSGPTTFCQGGSVTLSAPAGFTYLWSNGATTQSIVVTASDNYSVTVTNANGCSAASAATVVTVNANPSTPSITPSGPTTFCQGGSVTLSAPAGFTYLWSNGATTQSINVTASDNYSVTVTNGSGCSAMSAATTVTVNALPAQPTISGPASFCPGTSITLTAPAGYASYLWSNGQSGQSISVNTPGNYTVAVTNAQGCSRTSAVHAVTQNAATVITVQPLSFSMPRNSTRTLSVTATGTPNLQYQWYRGFSGDTSSPVVGEINSSYTFTLTKKGTYRYWVRVTSSTCTGSTVNSVTSTITVN